MLGGLDCRAWRQDVAGEIIRIRLAPHRLVYLRSAVHPVLDAGCVIRLEADLSHHNSHDVNFDLIVRLRPQPQNPILDFGAVGFDGLTGGTEGGFA